MKRARHGAGGGTDMPAWEQSRRPDSGKIAR